MEIFSVSGAVLEKYLHRIADITFGRIEVILCELGILHNLHFVAQGVDTLIGGNRRRCNHRR